jgi:hypothetical protein
MTLAVGAGVIYIFTRKNLIGQSGFWEIGMDLGAGGAFGEMLRQRMTEKKHEFTWEKISDVDLIVRKFWLEFQSRLLVHLNGDKQEPEMTEPSFDSFPVSKVNSTGKSVETFSENSKRIQVTLVLGLFFAIFISVCFVAASVQWKYS